jgi:hypothetical protein
MEILRVVGLDIALKLKKNKTMENTRRFICWDMLKKANRL